MAIFTHITDARLARRLRRSGVTPDRKLDLVTGAIEVRPNLHGIADAPWMPFDPAAMASIPRISDLTPREFDVLRGSGKAGLRGYLNDGEWLGAWFLTNAEKAFTWRHVTRRARVIYLMPLVANRQVSHGWEREIGGRFNAAITLHIRLDDATPVWVGTYGGLKHPMTAAEAHSQIRSLPVRDAQHYEVVIDRRIDPDEIIKVTATPKRTGWRHYPSSHGDHPDRYGITGV